MARLESQVDLCYVPTPLEVTKRVSRLLDVPKGAAVLDPCCGDGVAVCDMFPGAKRYGIELELERAETARSVQRMNVLACSMQEARVSHYAFGGMLLNPPYADDTAGRLEPIFLERCLRYLVPGGVLVHIIKQNLYPSVLRMLCRHFDVVGHWRFPDPYYDGPVLNYSQTVLVATKRAEPALDRDIVAFAELLGYAGELPILPASFVDRIPVPMGHEPPTFISGSLSDADVARLLATSPVQRTMILPSHMGCGNPPLTLKRGHIALTLASGVVNGVYGAGPTLHVAKGMVVRKVTVKKERDQTPGGNPMMVQTEVDSFVIKVRALCRDGAIQDMVGGPVAVAEAEGNSEQ